MDDGVTSGFPRCTRENIPQIHDARKLHHSEEHADSKDEAKPKL
jgi:hypothetical protein